MEKIGLVILGFFSGAILSWLQFKYIWITQRKLEEKFKILDDAARALAYFEREALDPKLQENKRKYEGGFVRQIELSVETDVLMRTTLIKTKALYSEVAYKSLDEAFKVTLDVKKVNSHSHHDFIQKTQKAIDEMGKEINAGRSMRFLSNMLNFKQL